MKFGIVAMEPSAASAVEAAVTAENAGLDSVFWGDHWLGLFPPALFEDGTLERPHRWYDPAILIAAAAAATSTLKFGTVVTDIIRHHPADLAQTFLTLEELHPGRVMLGVGAGEAENCIPYGLSYDRPVSHFAEMLPPLRALLRGDWPVTVEGPRLKLDRAALEVEPADVPIWIAAHGPRMLELTGRHADGWCPLRQSPRRYAASLATIRETAKEAGRDPEVIEAGICINVLLADSEAEARELTNHPLLRAFGLWTSNAAFTGLGRTHPLGEHFYPMRDYLPSAYTREEAERLVEQVPPEIVERVAIIGTPDQVAEEIRPYFDAGVEHLLLWDLAPFAGVKPGKVFDLAAALR